MAAAGIAGRRPASRPVRRPWARPALVVLHRWAGLAMAAFLVMAGLTGSVIAFDSELDAWLNPDLFRSPGRGPPLPPDALAAAVEAALPGAIAVSVPLNLPPGEAARVTVRGRVDPVSGRPVALAYDEAFADPVTGALLGTRDTGACCSRQSIIPFLYRFHYMLQLPGEWGHLGRWLLGAVAVLWLLDCFVGAWLTLPRGRPFLAKWRIAWGVKRRAGFHRVNLDLHRAAGLWFWPVLLAVAVSSIYFNLYRELFRPVVELISPLTPSVYEMPAPPPSVVPPPFGFDEGLARAQAEARGRGWTQRPDRIYRSSRGIYAVTYRPSQHRRGVWLGTPVIDIDMRDGRVLQVHVPGEGTAGDVIMDLQMPLHSGELLGLPGRILVCAAGIAVAMLSVTGVILWWRKRTARRTVRLRHRLSPRA
ncbi:PepSY-associated TM helix domain-containing protein [Marinibaculum pumilum]|uniref:PepSY-associated TM helix domain-containing protein n=1 Tax=Marinibaculum pumilum TaxID=1766165 RepID=A0ABV7L8K6_9PROT